MTHENLRTLIRDVPGFPRPGVIFKDITPLLEEPAAFAYAVKALAARIAPAEACGILAVESRGFLFGAGVALELGLPLHLLRKRGKLPRESVAVTYQLEYGEDRLELHADVISPGSRYTVVDDLIATGGTAAAAVELVERQHGTVACCAFLIELAFLDGRARLDGRTVESLIVY
ncbi:MAG: adenine phosphoribosyltransferase [Gammaproteobacteria bacterium]